MAQFQNPPSFQELLAYCTDRNSPYWEAGWREFVKRYNKFLYATVTKRCLNFNLPRLRRQLSDVVNDIVAEVYVVLSKSLGNYREVDKEQVFFHWLVTICNRAAGRYLRRGFVTAIVDNDVDEFQNYVQGLLPNTSMELYEDLVHKLRASGSKRKRNIERDINIFQFYVWADLSEAMIQAHPCLVNEGERVVENVVWQMRQFLRNKVL